MSNLSIQLESILSLYSTADSKAFAGSSFPLRINALLDLGNFKVEGKRTCQPLISRLGVYIGETKYSPHSLRAETAFNQSSIRPIQTSLSM